MDDQETARRSCFVEESEEKREVTKTMMIYLAFVGGFEEEKTPRLFIALKELEGWDEGEERGY